MGSMLSGVMGGGMLGGLFGGNASNDPAGELNAGGGSQPGFGEILKGIAGTSAGHQSAANSQTAALRNIIKLVGSATSGFGQRTRLQLQNQIVGNNDPGGETGI